EAIRQALAANPGKKPKEIAADLKGQGVEVTPALVSQIKSKSKGGKETGGAKRGRKARAEAVNGGQVVGNGPKASGGMTSSGMVPIDAVLAIKELQLQLGTDNLKRLVNVLS